MSALGRITKCLNKAVNVAVVSHQRHVLQGSQHLTVRSLSSRPTADDHILVGMADEDTYVCWHPEPTFPYEHTKPLPRKTAELELGDNVLKVQYISDYHSRYRPDGPTKDELQDMFFTTIHEWKPTPRKTKYNKKPPKDRDGI